MLTQNQLQVIGNLSYNNREREDNIKSYVTLGHYFNYNIAICLANTYCIKGKPSLNSDAMAGYARRYVDSKGREVLESMKVLHSDEKYCTMQIVRADERRRAVKRADQLNKPLYLALQQTNDPATIKMLLDAIMSNNNQASQAGIHTHTFTWEHAIQRKLSTQRAWLTMPKNMLQKRCQSALLREALPDIIGVTYTPDELAEMMIEDEDERDEIVFASVFQERVPDQPTQQPPAPQPTQQPTQQLPAPQPTQPNPYPRQFESTKTTAAEILMNIDNVEDDVINALAQETKVYLFDVQLNDEAKEHVKQACTKLKHKAFQCTIDEARKTANSELGLDPVTYDKVREYIVFGDPTSWKLHDEIIKMR